MTEPVQTSDETDSADAVAPPLAWWKEALRPFLTGLMFLTRLPCPEWVGHEAEYLARSTPYFPVIGLIVGGWGAAFFLGAALALPPMVAAIISTTATVWLTGAFHEDGLADACDGFGGGWGKDQILAIMKDSRIGSYGAVGLVLVMGAKLSCLATFSPEAALRALVAAHVLGRWSSLPLIWALPYVRETGAKGKPFAASVTPWRLTVGSILAAVIVVAAVGSAAWAPALAVLGVTVLAGRYFHRIIGGITGDCLGATNQLAEVAVYMVLVAWN